MPDIDKDDPHRWTVLVIFCVFSCLNAAQWITYAPIATAVRGFFHITTNQLNWLSLIYMVVFVVGAYFTCTTFERWGVRRGVLIGCGLNALGSILKVAPGIPVKGFPILMVSQTLNSFAQLFVLSTPPLIAAQYFPPHKRAFATAVAATANNLGNALALFIPPLIVTKGIASEFYILFGVQCGVSVAVTVVAYFFLKPPAFRAPSNALLARQAATHAAAQEGDDMDFEDDEEMVVSPVSQTTATLKPGGDLENITAGPRRRHRDDDIGSESKRKPVTLWQRVRHSQDVVTFLEVGHTVYRLCRNRDFVFLLVAFSVSVGSVWTYSSVLAQILEPFGLTPTMAGIAGAINVAAGVVMAYMVGLWVDRKRRYKHIVIVCLCGSVVCCVVLLVIMYTVTPETPLMVGLCMFLYIFAGVFQGTATPISFEFAMEISYPLPESVPAAMLMAGANLVSLILLSIASAMLGNDVPTLDSCRHVVIVIICVCAAGSSLSFLPRERLRRHQAELDAAEKLAEIAAEGNCPDADGNTVEPAGPEEVHSSEIRLNQSAGSGSGVKDHGREAAFSDADMDADRHGATPELREEGEERE